MGTRRLYLALPIMVLWIVCYIGGKLDWTHEYWWSFPFMMTAGAITVGALWYAVWKNLDK